MTSTTVMVLVAAAVAGYLIWANWAQLSSSGGTFANPRQGTA